MKEWRARDVAMKQTVDERKPEGRDRSSAAAARSSKSWGVSAADPLVLTVAETLPKSFLLAVQTRGDRPALREKVLGIWKTITWNEWLERAKEIAFALDGLGFRPGDVASVLANTVPEWCYADLGVLCAGGVSSGIYPTDSAKQVAYLVNNSTHPRAVRGGRRAARQGAGSARPLPVARTDRHLRHGRAGEVFRPDVRLLRAFLAEGRARMPGARLAGRR